MIRHQRQLRSELKAAGATNAELQPLLAIAAGLSRLRPGGVEDGRRARQGWRRMMRPAMYGVAGATLCVAMLLAAQTVLPTSWLFPAQRMSDNVAMRIHPAYRATVMMKRARQIDQLVTDHAAPAPILATLADYNVVANAYKSMPHASYAAFEYCESKLERAEAGASLAVRQAIAGSLYSLETS